MAIPTVESDDTEEEEMMMNDDGGHQLADTDPARTWTYRSLRCRLYRIELPSTPTRWIGYTKFADEWMEVIDRTSLENESSAVSATEKAVDRKILALKSSNMFDDDDDDGWGGGGLPTPSPNPTEPFDPVPAPYDPPNPDHHNPIWNGDTSNRTTTTESEDTRNANGSNVESSVFAGQSLRSRTVE